jgi:hypothetical protein
MKGATLRKPHRPNQVGLLEFFSNEQHAAFGAGVGKGESFSSHRIVCNNHINGRNVGKCGESRLNGKRLKGLSDFRYDNLFPPLKKLVIVYILGGVFYGAGPLQESSRMYCKVAPTLKKLLVRKLSHP